MDEFITKAQRREITDEWLHDYYRRHRDEIDVSPSEFVRIIKEALACTED